MCIANGRGGNIDRIEGERGRILLLLLQTMQRHIMTCHTMRQKRPSEITEIKILYEKDATPFLLQGKHQPYTPTIKYAHRCQAMSLKKAHWRLD